MKQTETLKALWSRWKYAALIAAAGAALLLLPAGGGRTDAAPAAEMEERVLRQMSNDQLKYAMIIFTTAPIIAAYPFLQRYFVKGVMVGSLKG